MSRAFRFTGMPSACYRGFFVSINLIYRTAVHECLKVGSSHVDQSDPGLNGCPCYVGCYDAVGSAEKRIGLEHRLNAYNVASEAAEKSAVQGGPYISFVDDGSSGYIDKDRSFIELGQGVFVDDLSCVIGKRAVERDDICTADSVFESKALNGRAAYVNRCSDKRCVVWGVAVTVMPKA